MQTKPPSSAASNCRRVPLPRLCICTPSTSPTRIRVQVRQWYYRRQPRLPQSTTRTLLYYRRHGPWDAIPVRRITAYCHSPVHTLQMSPLPCIILLRTVRDSLLLRDGCLLDPRVRSRRICPTADLDCYPVAHSNAPISPHTFPSHHARPHLDKCCFTIDCGLAGLLLVCLRAFYRCLCIISNNPMPTLKPCPNKDNK